MNTTTSAASVDLRAWRFELESHVDETHGDGVRKMTCRAPDGNEIGFGG